MDTIRIEMQPYQSPVVSIKCKKLGSSKVPNLARWGHASVYHDGKLYVFGGRREEDRNDILTYDLKTEQWNMVNSKGVFSHVPRPRRRHSAVFLGNQMVIFGGFDGGFFNDMHYAEFKKVYNAKDKDENYIADTLKCINNPFRSDINFILNYGKQNQSIFYSHSYILLYKLMSIQEEAGEPVPSLVSKIYKETKYASSERPILICLPSTFSEETLLLL